MIDIAQTENPQTLAMLRAHPRVQLAIEGPGALRFRQGAWQREVQIGSSTAPLYGLVELADNNPLVCTDVFSVPSAAATLVQIALGPLASAGMLLEVPTLQVNLDFDQVELDDSLRLLGWNDGVLAQMVEIDLGSVVAATAMAMVATPEDLDDLDEVFEERFGRSFFVRRDEASEWSANLVTGKPFAAYRLRITPDEPTSLLTIRVLADRQGKCGAAQVVHAMNVMAGFEESLGLA